MIWEKDLGGDFLRGKIGHRLWAFRQWDIEDCKDSLLMEGLHERDVSFDIVDVCEKVD